MIPEGDWKVGVCMARPRTKGLLYFPLDVDFFYADNRVRILKARYGADGITLYLYLLCKIYHDGYYIQWSDDEAEIVAEDLHMTRDKVMQVLMFLLDRSMLDKQLFQSDAILTSTGIQARWMNAVKERGRKTPIEVDGYWLLKEEETETFIKCTHFTDSYGKKDSFSRKNSDNSAEESLKKSKVKKTKEKETKVNNSNCSELPDGSPRKAQYHLIMNNGEMFEVTESMVTYYQEHYPGTDANLEFLKMEAWCDKNSNNRKTPSGMDPFVNNWFARAQNASHPSKQPKYTRPNAFHNFEQRDTDYNATELDDVMKWIQTDSKGGENDEERQEENAGSGTDES
jgi:hypothetical protein